MIILQRDLRQNNEHTEPMLRRQHKRRMRRIATATSVTTLLFGCFIVPVTVVMRYTTTISAFTVPVTSPYFNPYSIWNQYQQKIYNRNYSLKESRNAETTPSTRMGMEDVDTLLLLESVTLDQLKKLCDQCFVSYDDIVNENQNVDTNDNDNALREIKLQLLQRLRHHADTQAEMERQRHVARRLKVENNRNSNDEYSNAFDESSYNPKERYEIVEADEYDSNLDIDDSSDDGYFFFDLPTMSEDLKQAQIQSMTNQQNMNTKQENVVNKGSTILTSDQVTSPPPPIEPNANGERTVKIYSTTQLNDLTAIAASQPGQNNILSSLDSTLRRSGGKQSESQPWDFSEQQQYTSSDNNHPYIEKAKEQLIELLSTLLSMSGAPGFATPDDYLDNDDDDDDDASDGNDVDFRPYQPNGKMQNPTNRQGLDAGTPGTSNVNGDRVGFNPVNVPVDLLSASSKAIRACRGEVLDEVLRQYEIQGIGYDGTAGDNTAGGGGHYREVIKVRAFLEGYRRAEVRRLARETSSMLLNKLMIEGIDALDLTLNTMIRSNDDSEEYGGTQLNDSLLDFLNDAIRQKEKEVERTLNEDNGVVKTWTDQLTLPGNNLDDDDEDDDLDQYWKTSEVDGQRIETFDPNDEKVKNVLKSKFEKIQQQGTTSNKNTIDIPKTAPEQVLLLLQLLRERIKTEAAFSSDEKGRNLRLLAYCIRADTDDECEQHILKQLGNSLDVRCPDGLCKSEVVSFCLLAFFLQSCT